VRLLSLAGWAAARREDCEASVLCNGLKIPWDGEAAVRIARDPVM
jgi:hypothetical protein